MQLMSGDPNQNGHFEPIHEAHAIEQVQFVLQFDRSLNDAAFAEVCKIAEQFVPELPARSEMQSFEVAIGVSVSVAPASSKPSVGGVMFRRVQPDETVESELRIERTSVTFRTTLYTRWDTVWARARKYFDAIVPKYVGQANISGISLNFVDKFVWSGDKCRPNLLLRPASAYLCPHVYTAQDLWHSHTGAFIRADNNTKRLLNVNVALNDEARLNEVRRVVVITTVMTDLMNQPGYAPSEVAAEKATEFLGSHMKQLHLFGKEVFGNLINDEMCKRIALVD